MKSRFSFRHVTRGLPGRRTERLLHGTTLLAVTLVLSQAASAQGTLSPLAAGQTSAQTSSDNTLTSAAATDTYHIHGIVIDSQTSRPVARAVVQAFGDRLATMTDNDGRFTLDLHFTNASQASAQRMNIIAARMIFPSVMAHKPGYTTNMSGHILQTVSLDDLSRDIVLKLMPESSIQGRVMASGDDHPEGVRVTLFSRRIQEGVGHWAIASISVTNSEGEFRFAGLAAGGYRLMTQEWSDQPGQPEPNKPASRYAPVVYPSGSSPTAGPEIRLAAGETLPVNFNLHPETFYPVRIPVADSGTAIGLQARVEREGAASGMNLRYNVRDKAMEGFLPPGTYQIALQTQGPSAAAATVPLTVGGGPAETAPVTLSPVASIPVIVHKDFTRQETAEPVRLPGGVAPTVQVLLQPEEMNVPTPIMTPNREDGQKLTVDRVLPGSYRAQILAFRGYVAAATSGGTDLLRSSLLVGAGSSVAPIEITLRDDAAAIQGTLDSALLQSGSDSEDSSLPTYVLCVPSGNSSQRVMQTVARNGSFLLSNVPPGSYRIYASRLPFNEVEYRGEAWRKANESKGVAVTVEAGASVTATLTTLIDAEAP